MSHLCIKQITDVIVLLFFSAVASSSPGTCFSDASRPPEPCAREEVLEKSSSPGMQHYAAPK